MNFLCNLFTEICANLQYYFSGSESTLSAWLNNQKKSIKTELLDTGRCFNSNYPPYIVHCKSHMLIFGWRESTKTKCIKCSVSLTKKKCIQLKKERQRCSACVGHMYDRYSTCVQCTDVESFLLSRKTDDLDWGFYFWHRKWKRTQMVKRRNNRSS